MSSLALRIEERIESLGRRNLIGMPSHGNESRIPMARLEVVHEVLGSGVQISKLADHTASPSQTTLTANFEI